VDTPQAQPPTPSSAEVRPAAGAAEYGPQGDEERDLCDKASHFDWAYMGVMVLADAGTVVLDSQGFQSSGQAGVRLIGPALVGLSWGWTVGGTYLTLPQCSKDFAHRPPAEGDTRSVWPLALSFSVLAAVMGPVIVGVETGEGTQTLQWSPTERAMRLVIAGATGVVGSVMPYVLPPKTWRAMRKLQHLHAGGDAHGALVSYSFTF
jgi:hypothetical protein